VTVPGGPSFPGEGGGGSGGGVGGGGTCVLFSGGFGGLVRCSVVPPHVTVQRMPSSTKYNFSAVKKAPSKGKAATAVAAATMPPPQAKGGTPAAGSGGADPVAAVRLDHVSGRIVPASTASGGGGPVTGAIAAEVTPGVAATPETPGSVGGDQAAVGGADDE